MNDGLNNTEQMYSPCIVCYRVNGVTILRSEETGELRGIEEPLETVCPYSVEEYALTKSLDAVLNKRDRKLLEKTIKYSLQGTTQGNGLTGSILPVRFSM